MLRDYLNVYQLEDMQVFLLGHGQLIDYAPVDGTTPPITYYYDETSMAVVDGVNVLKPNDVDTSEPGRFLKKSINCDWLQMANKPNFSNVAFSGTYADLNGKPALFDGNYNSLTNKPVLFDGNYNSLSNRPTLFSGNYNDLTNKPSIPAAQVNSDWSATSGVAQILNKPTIPTNTNQLTNGAGFITGITGAQVSTALGYTPIDSAGARNSISLTTTGTSGSATYNASTGVL